MDKEKARLAPGLFLEEAPLIGFFSSLFPVPLAGQGFFHAALFAGLQVEAVTLHFLDDVLGLYLALEAPQRVFKRLAFLYANLCQSNPPRFPARQACSARGRTLRV